MKKRVAFDLDETLAVAVVDSRALRGFAIRPGCTELLTTLAPRFELILWSSSERTYVNRALDASLKTFFHESYSWQELPHRWKDIRLLHADFLVDDSDHHMQEAAKYGLEDRYIIVPAYGAPEDVADPLAWTRIILGRLARDTSS
jgi:hypothetical protein